MGLAQRVLPHVNQQDAVRPYRTAACGDRLRRVKERQGLSTAQWEMMELLVLEATFHKDGAVHGKSTGLGVRKPSATSALWPQVSHLTWGLILHG